jgi:nucleotide-binding universal stress UspA family protein
MRHILTCTDGSAYARSVYELTAWAAHRLDAAVHVLHMIDPHRERAESVDLSGNIGLDTGQALLNELVDLEEKQNRLAREQGKLVLAEAGRQLGAAGVTRLTVEQRHGELVETVTRLEEKADLLILGKRGESAGFASDHLGSNVERVIRASIRPVFVASREFPPVDSFLLAYDGGQSMTKALEFLVSQPLLRGLRCQLLRAGRIDADAGWFAGEAAAKLRAAGYDVTVELTAGEPEKVIADSVAHNHIGVVLMGAYGHSRIRQLVVGSTTTAILRTCHVPVLMFR